MYSSIIGHEKERRSVTFLPGNRRIVISPENNLLDAARLLDIPLIADCGGVGVCGKCRLKLISGSVQGGESPGLVISGRSSVVGGQRSEVSERPDGEGSQVEDGESRGLLPDGGEVEERWIVACKSYPLSNVTVEVPRESISPGVQLRNIEDGNSKAEAGNLGLVIPGSSFQASTAPGGAAISYPISPLVEKIYLECTPDESSDMDMLFRTLREKTGMDGFTINFKTLRELPRVLRSSDWKITAALGRDGESMQILSVEAGDTSRENYGIVIDIGTTTIEGILAEIPSGKTRFFASHLNPQSKYGDDVTARLNFASRNNGLLVLNDIIIDKINEILMELVIESGVPMERVYSIVFSANTIMLHLFLGLDTESIRRHPQTPVALNFPLFRASDLSLYANPDALVYLVPGVGSLVGGDVVSSLIFTGMPGEDFLLVDLGTNREVAMVSGGEVICAATSAGPAFEGGGVKWGMRATSGAINRVFFSQTHKDFTLSTIGNQPPRGICGTGLIDFLATLLLTGFIDKKGKFRGRRRTSRIRTLEGVEEFVLAFSSRDEDVISVTEQDIAYLIRSKGAFYAGLTFLLEKMGKKAEELDKFYIAGALGGFLNIENGITIGLFPDLPLERFQFLGNGSLLGGRILLLSEEARRQAREIARSAAYVDLAREPAFNGYYTSALFLPHTDLDRFPRVTASMASAE